MTHAIDIKELVSMLSSNIAALCQQLCPGGTVEGHDYVVRNPIREDRNPGSFRICITGAKAGVWKEFATGDAGDALELVAYLGQLDKRDAVVWSKKWLGLDGGTPEEFKARKREATAAQKRREEEARRDAARRSRQAHAIYLEAQSDLTGTPVERYLAGRGIHLADLPRPPRAIRYAAACWCSEVGGPLPAMVAAIHGLDGSFLAVHRTYLRETEDGRIVKADLRDAKRTLGTYRRGCIRLWKGGGRKPLAQLPPGSAVTISEGIEDGLTCAIADPARMVLCAVSLANMGQIELPEAVGEITLAQQNDLDGSAAATAFDKACQAFLAQGRRVFLFAPPPGVKDVNDLLQDERGAV